MPRIAQRRAPAKHRAIPCCICQQPHPEDETNHRMREHEHQGRRCLGGDIPFARHSDPPMGKVVGWIRSHDPMPNRTHAIYLARDGGLDERIIDALFAEGIARDLPVLQWMKLLITLLQKAQLDEVVNVRRVPRLRLVRERRAAP